MSWDGSLLLPLQIHASPFTSYSSVPEADSWKFLLDSFTLWLPQLSSANGMPVASGKRKESGVSVLSAQLSACRSYWVGYFPLTKTLGSLVLVAALSFGSWAQE